MSKNRQSKRDRRKQKESLRSGMIREPNPSSKVGHHNHYPIDMSKDEPSKSRTFERWCVACDFKYVDASITNCVKCGGVIDTIEITKET